MLPDRNRLLAVAVVLLALAALHFTRPVTVPLAGGLMLAAIGWPLQDRLERRLPRPLALLATILVLVLILLALLTAGGWSAATVAKDLQGQSERISILRDRLNAVTSGIGVTLPEIGGSGTGSGNAPTGGDAGGSADAQNGIARTLGVALYTMLGYLGLSVGFAALALAEWRDARERIRGRFSSGTANNLLDISSKIAASIRRYLAVKSLTSVIAGVSTGLIALAFGIKYALIWAFLAFLLEYVPTVGSLLAVVPPVLYAFVQFNGFSRPLAALATLTVAQLFLGNYVDPRLEGRLLSISPVIVLFSIVFWAIIWGPAGALLGVPITVAITIATRRFEGTRWIWALLTEADDDE